MHQVKPYPAYQDMFFHLNKLLTQRVTVLRK